MPDTEEDSSFASSSSSSENENDEDECINDSSLVIDTSSSGKQSKNGIVVGTCTKCGHSKGSNGKSPTHQRFRTTNSRNIRNNVNGIRNNGNVTTNNNGTLRNGHNNVRERNIQQESWKALVAMLYFFIVTLITAFVMVIVHDRVPDMATYPPLPDIFLDNVPLIPWAFQMCELCGLILFIMWSIILIVHKYRFILLRRMFSLFGSIFLLRCVTMLITSLSVPGRHLECKARPYGNWTERLLQAYVIWQGGGMSLKGVRTCGDYMFSGHTVVLTLLNFFITEYTPVSLYYVHTASWVLNLFGIFFILAGHEHYSIDVFIAFYISTRLFLYYHTLANNRALYQPDRRRTKVWFPLFSFFESGVNGIVPNQFDSMEHLNMSNISKIFLRFQSKIKDVRLKISSSKDGASSSSISHSNRRQKSN